MADQGIGASPLRREDARFITGQVHVEYAELAAVTTARAALSADAPQLHAVAPNNLCNRYERGDRARTDAAFAQAAHVTRIELVNQRLAGSALERALPPHMPDANRFVRAA